VQEPDACSQSRSSVHSGYDEVAVEHYGSDCGSYGVDEVDACHDDRIVGIQVRVKMTARDEPMKSNHW